MQRDQLSISQAVRLIFPTGTNAARQEQAVEHWLASGALVGQRSPRTGEWVTTKAAVAEFLASEAARRAQIGVAARGGRNPVVGTGAGKLSARQVTTAQDLYQDAWREFFLSVLGRRSAKKQGERFQLAVLSAQVLIVVAIVVAGFLAVRGNSLTTEQAAIVNWIDENMGPHEVTQWYPPAPGPDGVSCMRVQFAYYSVGSQRVQTDRTFRVFDGAARPVTLPHEADD